MGRCRSRFRWDSTVRVGFVSYVALKYARKPTDYPIEVFTNGAPVRAFEQLAILDVHCESHGWMTPNLEHDTLPVLMREAREAGCDAIIEIEARKPANWTLETRTPHFTAVDVAYK